MPPLRLRARTTTSRKDRAIACQPIPSAWPSRSPTGSKDPYALRRAALGVIRIILENGLRLRLAEICGPWFWQLATEKRAREVKSEARQPESGENPRFTRFVVSSGMQTFGRRMVPAPVVDLISFFADRLKVQLRERGARHDLVDAVF